MVGKLSRRPRSRPRSANRLSTTVDSKQLAKVASETWQTTRARALAHAVIGNPTFRPIERSANQRALCWPNGNRHAVHCAPLNERGRRKPGKRSEKSVTDDRIECDYLVLSLVRRPMQAQFVGQHSLFADGHARKGKAQIHQGAMGG